MKKLFTAAVIFAIFALGLAGCGDANQSGNVKTTLTIKNLSDYNNLQFLYGTIDFGVMARGSEVTKEVSEGIKYINIRYSLVVLEDSSNNKFIVEGIWRVNEVINCEEGKNTQFTISNNTLVTAPGGYKGDNKDETDSLKNIIESMLNYYREQQ